MSKAADFDVPVLIIGGGPVPEDDTFGYRPTTFPGARAPHVWLADGKSILDLFGDGFVLLQFADVPVDTIEHAAAKRGVPLRIHRIEQADAAALYQRVLVLVRPDGHVAWRGDRPPDDALALIDTARGAVRPGN